MNYKNLNYEIETTRGTSTSYPAMNYKNLNYEIETRLSQLLRTDIVKL